MTEAKAMEIKKIGKEVTQITNIIRNLPISFSDTLVTHMNRLNITVEYLEEKTLINSKIIQRMRNDERYQAKLQSIMALCIGLNLDPLLSYDLIKKSGHNFRPIDEHVLYRRILNYHYRKTIFECNKILEINNFNPLSK